MDVIKGKGVVVRVKIGVFIIIGDGFVGVRINDSNFGCFGVDR